MVARGRAAAGAHLVFDALEAVCARRAGRDRRRPTGCSPRSGRSSTSPWRSRYMRHLLRAGRPAEAAAFAEPWLARRRGQSALALSGGGLAADRRSALAMARGRRRLVGVYDIGDELPLARRAGRAAARPAPRRCTSRSNNRCAAAPRPTGRCSARIEPEIRALRAAIVDAVERHIAQLPPPEPGHPSSADRDAAPIRFSGSWSVRLTGGGFHANHVHPAGWISSAFYVALARGRDGRATPGRLADARRAAGRARPRSAAVPRRSSRSRAGWSSSLPPCGTAPGPFAEGERLTVAFDVARPR